MYKSAIELRICTNVGFLPEAVIFPLSRYVRCPETYGSSAGGGRTTGRRGKLAEVLKDLPVRLQRTGAWYVL